MKEDADAIGLYSDAALEDPMDDQLGYRKFATGIADTIDAEIVNEEFIVGIYGQWGSGKSTIVNFIEHELKHKSEPPTIIRFNPWWFSDEADLIEKYLSQLSASIEGYTDIDELRIKIASYARSFSKIPLSSFGIPANKAAESVAAIAETDPSNINELHEEIADHLANYDKNIVVIIDDIDRLPPAEIRHMFRVIKSVAAFPNITYVVAFDETVVTEALEGYQGVSDGQEYLQKIIQLPLNIPQPQKGTLHLFLSEKLNEIIYTSETLFDDDRWEKVYREGIQPLIETPRDSIRLANAVQTALRGIESEVNFVDVAGIETIRLHAPDVYEEIRINENKLTERINVSERDTQLYKNIISCGDSSTEDNIRRIIGHLFPAVNRGLGVLDKKPTINSSDYSEQNRICNPNKFYIYYRQSVGTAEVTDSIMQHGIQTTTSAEAFSSFLENQLKYRGPKGRTRAYNFIAEFQERYDECHVTGATLRGLFKTGDKLVLADPPQNRVDLGSEEYIIELAGKLIAGRRESKRYELLEKSFKNSQSPYIMVAVINRIEQGATFTDESDNKQVEQRLLKHKSLEQLKEIICDRIEEMAYSGSLFDAPHLHIIIKTWVEWDNTDICQSWFNTVLDSDEDMLEFLQGLIETGQVYSLGNSKEIRYLDPEWLEPLIDPEKALQIVENIVGLDQSEKESVTVLRESIRIRNQGSDPQSLNEWT